MVDLANRLCEQYDITIFTIYAKGELESQLSPKIKLKSLCDKTYTELSKIQKFGMSLKVLFLKRSIYHNKIKKDYDVEIAFLEGPITRLFMVKNEKTKKVVWIHNDISLVFGKGIKAKIKKIVDKKVYSKYKTLVFVSKENLKNFQETYPNIQNEKKVIYNYLEKESILQKAEEIKQSIYAKDEINIVTVARLVPQKAIDRLLKVHSQLLQEGLKHHIYVVGDGPEKEKLEKQIKEYRVEDTFTLLGKKENPYPYVKQADYFGLFSEFEGYGMVLEEAKILNKPIIITDTAAREAVKGYSNSKIVKNSEKGIYEGVKELISNQNIKKKKETKKLEYNNDTIIEQVKQVIGE